MSGTPCTGALVSAVRPVIAYTRLHSIAGEHPVGTLTDWSAPFAAGSSCLWPDRVQSEWSLNELRLCLSFLTPSVRFCYAFVIECLGGGLQFRCTVSPPGFLS